MLVTASVKEEWRTKIPAVTHIDNSARYQSVTPVSNPRFYQIINKFYEKTGVPVLLNTSFIQIFLNPFNFLEINEIFFIETKHVNNFTANWNNEKILLLIRNDLK